MRERFKTHVQYMCAITYTIHRDTQIHISEHKSKRWVFLQDQRKEHRCLFSI
jgi:hypothetical protein